MCILIDRKYEKSPKTKHKRAKLSILLDSFARLCFGKLQGQDKV